METEITEKIHAGSAAPVDRPRFSARVLFMLTLLLLLVALGLVIVLSVER